MIANPTPPIDVSNGMSLDDFMRLSHEQPFEIVNGRRIDKMASGQLHSEVIQKIFILLYLYITQLKLGRLYQETTFVLPEKRGSKWVTGSRLPDIMFYVGNRIEEY
ncbi:MAG TPA: Uma2 family endonuclease, partial [Aggregatilineales bacterium]|nr:Uma2 family endonuclease [Aggregatilineales bacterium]